MMCCVNRTLTGFITNTRPRNTFDITITLGMPAASNALLMCPTDTWQTGQTGARSRLSAVCLSSLCPLRRVFFAEPDLRCEADE